MQTITLQAATLACIVNAQENRVLDCTSHRLMICDRYADHGFRVGTLELIPSKTPTYLALKCTPHSEHVHADTILIGPSDRHTFSFQVLDDNLSENPILKAVPLVEIFPTDNVFNWSKKVPAGSPYLCSIEETHQLLQLCLFDLTAEDIQRFPLPLKLWHDLTWPTPNAEPAYRARFALDGPDPDTTPIRTGLHPVDTNRIYADFSRFYILRNSVILAAIFPYLRTLCAWDADIDDHPPGPLSDLALQQVLQRASGAEELLAYPLRYPTADLCANQGYEALSIANFFPKPRAERPEHPEHSEHSPQYIASRIRDAIQQVQANSLQC